MLSGVDEARLTFLAARRWYGWDAGRLLVIDIGGGSLEVAMGSDEDPTVALSVPAGAGRVTREFLPENGIANDRDLEDARRNIRKILEPMVKAFPKSNTASIRRLCAFSNASARAASTESCSVTSSGMARCTAGRAENTIREASGSAQEFQFQQGSGSGSAPK